MRPALAGVAAAVLIAGCGSEEETDEPAAARDCGRYEHGHGPLLDAQRAQNRCLLDALGAGEAATLVVARATVEGDPITTRYVVTTGGDIELTVDTTQDRYGPQAVATLTCTGLRGVNGFLEGRGCERAP